MELSILYAINELHNTVLDKIMTVITTLGDAGIIWIVIAIVLLLNKKTRKCGFLIAVSLLLGIIFGNIILKNLIARPRPFSIDGTIELLIKAPKDYSFPSGHTLASFEAAVIIFLHNKKWGIPALVLATLIAFSRMYLFVHYPTDIIAGAILGTLISMIVFYGYENYKNKKENKQEIKEV